MGGDSHFFRERHKPSEEALAPRHLAPPATEGDARSAALEEYWQGQDGEKK